MTATLTVTREGFGIELRRGTFDILVDGRNVGSVQAHVASIVKPDLAISLKAE